MTDHDVSDRDGNTIRPPRPSLALWNFSSQWFLIPQGTGIIAVILHNLKYQFTGLKIISEIVWVYTIVLLLVFFLIYLLRVCIFPRHVAHVLRTSIAETSCLASISIAFNTVIQMVILCLVSQWGRSWGIVAFVLWWIDTSTAITACILLPYIHVKLQPPGIQSLTPTMLLPLIASLTSAACGGILCVYGQLSPSLQVPVIIVSYLEIGMALPLAMSTVGVFQSRLVNKSFPNMDHIYEDMLTCGPFGQGSFALLILGKAVKNGAFAGYNRGTFLTADIASGLSAASQFAGLLAWGYATFWWTFSVVSIVHTAFSQPGGIRKSRFSMSAWSLVFPMGVYTNAAVQLSVVMDSPAFAVWSVVLILMLLIIWLVNHALTIKGVITGKVLGPGGPVEAPAEHKERTAV